MKARRPQLIVIILTALAALGCSCSDIEKYQKPAEQSRPVVKSVDLKGTPEEQAAGREFTGRLEAVRTQLTESMDTLAAIASLDSLVNDAENRRQTLPDTSEFRAFYLLMMADILNEVSSYKMRTGDVEGACAARQKLFYISHQLPK